jgi:hypothetical protein
MNKLLVKQLDDANSNNESNVHNANPNNYDIKSWEDIFLIQARKDGANYTMLKEWLTKYFDEPKLKTL